MIKSTISHNHVSCDNVVHKCWNTNQHEHIACKILPSDYGVSNRKHFFLLVGLDLSYVDGDLPSTQVYIRFRISDGPMLLIFRQYVARFYKLPFFLHIHV